MTCTVFCNILQMTKKKKIFSIYFSGIYSEVTYDDETSDNYCQKLPFSFAFGILICFWIFLPIACCCGAMACCCMMLAKCKKGENPA